MLLLNATIDPMLFEKVITFSEFICMTNSELDKYIIAYLSVLLSSIRREL